MDPAASSFAKAVKHIKFHLAHLFIRVCRRLPEGCYRNAAELGQSLEFSLWITRTFGRMSPFVATRDRLWARMISHIRQDAKITVFEFGVAYGHATKWWLAHCGWIDTWYGFDTFKGLPRAWRHFPAGAFSADGKPPDIEDPRVEWVVGNVEETFSADMIRTLSPGDGEETQRVFLIDLDLYEPIRYVLEEVFPQLKEGDLLYFDEAADWDERRALLEAMNGMPVLLELIGATPMALALRVVAE